VGKGAHSVRCRVPDHLAAEYPLPSDLRRATAKLDRFEIEEGEQILDRGGHRQFGSS
jgi:hypothetical protein